MRTTFLNTTILCTLLLIGSFTNARSVSEGETLYADSVELKPAFITVKKSVVRLYPNPTTDGTVKVSATVAEESLHFYVFDIEGILIGQAKLGDRKLHTIANLKKGVYMYEVFKNDVSIEQGRIIAK